ncbi:MAG: non-ribosomal peptide synthetase, partial [Psychrosphaera sp.]|nr:non-ribosomal peptide synthetase [Psychrosphaera sp.]
QPFTSLKEAVVAGEALTLTPNIQSALAHNSFDLINHYGPCETHVVAEYVITSSSLSQSSSLLPPIGRPLANHKFYVLSPTLAVLPQGAIGQLYVSGVGLARGYLNQPQLNAQKFVANPFAPAGDAHFSRLYHTGDLVRYLPDGNLEFIGRSDDQIKIRGLRIELGEIESQLLGCKGVASCRVLAREDDGGDKRLVAYLVSDAYEGKSESEFNLQLKTQLHQLLPDHMVPSSYVHLEQWPLTVNGKVDTKALPAHDNGLLQSQYVAPVTKTEKTLTDIWAQLFKLDAQHISATEDFFALGGHSLLTIRLLSLIKRDLGLSLEIREIFDKNTIQTLAQICDIQIKSQQLAEDLADTDDAQLEEFEF